MSTAGGYFSPWFFDVVDRASKARTIIREGFSPRKRKCGACSRPCMTTPLRSYFCRECWIYIGTGQIIPSEDGY